MKFLKFLLESKKKYDYSSLQVKITDNDVIKKLKEFRINKEDLVDDGIENDPHITINILGSGTFKEIKEVLKGQGPIKATLKNVDIFENEEDIVKISIESPDMQRINKLVKEKFKTKSSHPVYNPHVTIAYVKSGEGKKYKDSSNFDGIELVFDMLEYSNRKGITKKIKLSK